MRRAGIVGALAVLVAGRVSGAKPESSPPFMARAGQDRDDSDSTLSVECSPKGRGVAICTLTYVSLVQPKVDVAQRAKDLAELDKRAQSKEGQAEFKKECTTLKNEPLPRTAIWKQFSDRFLAACSANDLTAEISALRWWREEVEDRSCHVDVFTSKGEFSKVDDNTWRSIDTANECGATVVETFSRKAGLWTYDSARTVPSNAKEACRNPSGQTTSTTTYGPHLSPPRELRCRYWQ
jgi:hypothetical protein